MKTNNLVSSLPTLEPVHSNLFAVDFISPELSKEDTEILTNCVYSFDVNDDYINHIQILFELNVSEKLELIPYDIIQKIKNIPFSIQLSLHTTSGQIFYSETFLECEIYKILGLDSFAYDEFKNKKLTTLIKYSIKK